VLRPVYEIDTPENVRFHLERAGLASRAVAWLLDVLVMGCLLQLGVLLFGSLRILAGEAATVLSLVAAFLVQWWYAALCEWRFAGRTLGKWIVGIAARDQRGLRLTLLQTTIRNLLRVVDWVPGVYLGGGVSALLDPHGRRLGDLAAGTVVVRERTRALPARRFGEGLREVARYPAIAQAARRLTPEERDAVLMLHGQRDALSLALRLELFERLCRHLEQRYGVARPAHLSAEKVVLYTAAALADAS
jgi:uncharacterized RDD family membrane protein YckC